MPELLKKITKKQWQTIGKNAVILILLFALLFAIAVMSYLWFWGSDFAIPIWQVAK